MKKTTLLKPSIIIEVVSALYILLFVYTGVNKFMAIKDLRTVLKQYPLLEEVSELIAWGLPATEMIVAGLLFFSRTRLLGLYSSLGLILSFTLYLCYMLFLNENLPCTCGGMLQKLTWPQHLVFNIIFLTLAIIAILVNRKQLKRRMKAETVPIVFS